MAQGRPFRRTRFRSRRPRHQACGPGRAASPGQGRHPTGRWTLPRRGVDGFTLEPSTGERPNAVGSNRGAGGMPSGAFERSSAEPHDCGRIDPWRRMSRVPSSAATAASKRPPSRFAPDDLAGDDAWVEALELFRERNPRRTDRIEAYEGLIETGTHLSIAQAVLAGCYRPAPPVEGWLNKADGRKKRVFRYPPADELLFRVLNRMLQPAASEASPWCRSFLPGGGARAAFRGLLADKDAEAKTALRLDVRDYF